GPPEIARAEEGRQSRGTAEAVPVAGPVAGGWMTLDALGSQANQAVGLGLHGPVSGADLYRLVAFYAERGVEPRLEVCAFAHESLLRGLAERGFVLREFEGVLARPPGGGVAPEPTLVALKGYIPDNVRESSSADLRE